MSHVMFSVVCARTRACKQVHRACSPGPSQTLTFAGDSLTSVKMTLESILSQMGAGTKLTDRFSEYASPVHEQQFYYAYEPSGPSHGAPVQSEPASKYSHGGGHKNNAAMSALTLLAFLFFLHILQQCIKDHMTAMSTPQIMIMTAGREGEENVLKKSDVKLDKTGLPNAKTVNIDSKSNKKIIDNSSIDKDKFMRINTAEPPKIGGYKHKVFQNNGNKSISFHGFVSAMDYE